MGKPRFPWLWTVVRCGDCFKSLVQRKADYVNTEPGTAGVKIVERMGSLVLEKYTSEESMCLKDGFCSRGMSKLPML